METGELIRKVRRIQIAARRLVEDALSGTYSSAFRGLGMEFDEVREYQAGDDVRSIDWNVTARAGHPYVKRYCEERELTVLLLVDGSSSAAFGSGAQSKLELAGELSAAIALAAVSNHDKVGLALFTDKVDLYLPPRKGQGHVLRLIREILNFAPTRAGTDIGQALEFLSRVQRRRALVFLISDFFSGPFEHALDLASKRHEIIPLHIMDRREQELPALGLVRLEDAETGEQVIVDTASRALRSGYTRASEQFTATLEQGFRKRDLDYLTLRTAEDYLLPMRRLFKRREKRH